MMPLDVIGFGALNVDKIYEVNRIAGGNEESFVTGFSESCGGSAANSIVAMAKLRLNTGFVGKLAKDREGELHLEEFERWDVDTGGIAMSADGRSGTAIGFVDREGERALYIDPGVNDELRSGEVDIDYVEKADFLHLTSFVGDAPFERQVEVAKEIGDSVKISFDPGILYARRGMDSLRPILRRTYVMMPNEREVRILTGEDYEEGARKLIGEGPDIVAVKLGGEGCYVTDGKDDVTVDPFKVEAIDTTGAGDAFSAGFIYGLEEGGDLRECGKFGNFVASRCIEKRGARRGLPIRSEIDKIRGFTV